MWYIIINMSTQNYDDVDKYVHLISFVSTIKNSSGVKFLTSDKITSFGVVNQEKISETDCANLLRHKINQARRIQCLTDLAMNVTCVKDENQKQNCTLQYIPIPLYYRIKDNENIKFSKFL